MIRLFITISLLFFVSGINPQEIPTVKPKIEKPKNFIEIKDSIVEEVEHIILIDSANRITKKTIELQNKLFDKKVKAIEERISTRKQLVAKAEREKKVLRSEIEVLKDSLRILSQELEPEPELAVLDSICIKWKFFARKIDVNCTQWKYINEY